MKLIFKRILALFPTPLPLTVSQYDTWLDEIVELAGPIADKDSLEWVISNEVMRLNPGRDKVSKHLFVKLLRKYAANQFAANKVMELKTAQEVRKKQAEEAAKLQQAEDAAKQAVECPPISTN